MLSRIHPHCIVAVFLFAVLAATLRAQTNEVASTPAGSVAILHPLGMTYDSQANLFFAESGNHVIRRLDPAGNLSTVAGTGTQGFSGDGGPAIKAQLDAPSAVVLDSAGNLFIADTHNHRIRRIDAATYVITTIAGTGIAGFSGDGGPATMAALASPLGLAIGPANLLYLADSRNHRVRSIDLQTGVITTVAGGATQGFSGDGNAAINARLDTPSGLAIDSNRNVFVADTENHRVRRIDATDHTITTVAGSSASSRLLRPVSLVATAAGILIADASGERVLSLDPSSGILNVLAGQGTQSFQGDNGPATAAMLNTPTGLAIAPSGSIALADAGNERIRQINADGSISTLAGFGTPAAGSLTLSGATTQSYGATTLVASLSGGVTSQGTISLLDTTTGNTALLSQTTLSGGLARFSLPTLAAGVHLLLATFPGDGTHLAAQSQILNVIVAPIPLTATIAGNLTALFGQPLAALHTTLTGALPTDITRLTANAAVDASATSQPGTYPISIALSGPAAANYIFTAPAATLTVAKAPVTATITQAGGILTARVVSSTIGSPTGTLTLLTSAGTRFTSIILDKTGTAEISTAGLANGTYTLAAVYSGDLDFLSAQSTPLTVTIGAPAVPADFSFSVAGSGTQTVTPGETAQYTVNLNLSGTSALAGPITLSASALPVGFTANFDPPVISPGGTITSFTLSVATPRALASNQSFWIHGGCCTLACLLPLMLIVVSRRRRILLGSLAALALCGCGARINSTAVSQTASTTYPITITGTTTNLDGSVLQHTASISLVVR